MGSLMPGWDSPRSGGIEERKSFTKEEIDSFWKIKREVEEEHLKEASTILEDDTMLSKIVGTGNHTFSNGENEDAQLVKNEESLRNKKLTWWTRSNSAFLNEPPQSEMEGATQKYFAQHHVAMIGGQKQGLSIDVMAST